VNIDGVMPLGVFDPTMEDDRLGVTDGTELPYHLRYGVMTDRPCDRLPAIDTGCQGSHEFSFHAEYVYDLPV
jgi:hypothetical protein